MKKLNQDMLEPVPASKVIVGALHIKGWLSDKLESKKSTPAPSDNESDIDRAL
jgi:hypothetical protein